jgi:dihydrofolate synthase/folylpolyglutamate synthase
MQFSSLNEWLGWLETCHPQEIDLGLERIRVVAQALQLFDPRRCMYDLRLPDLGHL